MLLNIRIPVIEHASQLVRKLLDRECTQARQLLFLLKRDRGCHIRLVTLPLLDLGILARLFGVDLVHDNDNTPFLDRRPGNGQLFPVKMVPKGRLNPVPVCANQGLNLFAGHRTLLILRFKVQSANLRKCPIDAIGPEVA